MFVATLNEGLEELEETFYVALDENVSEEAKLGYPITLQVAGDDPGQRRPDTRTCLGFPDGLSGSHSPEPPVPVSHVQIS